MVDAFFCNKNSPLHNLSTNILKWISIEQIIFNTYPFKYYSEEKSFSQIFFFAYYICTLYNVHIMYGTVQDI